MNDMVIYYYMNDMVIYYYMNDMVIYYYMNDMVIYYYMNDMVIYYKQVFVHGLCYFKSMLLLNLVLSSINVTFLGFIILLASNSVSYISWPRRHSIG